MKDGKKRKVAETSVKCLEFGNVHNLTSHDPNACTILFSFVYPRYNSNNNNSVYIFQAFTEPSR